VLFFAAFLATDLAAFLAGMITSTTRGCRNIMSAGRDHHFTRTQPPFKTAAPGRHRGNTHLL
jgi:hypothetical protein